MQLHNFSHKLTIISECISQPRDPLPTPGLSIPAMLPFFFFHARRISTNSQICSFAERRPFKNGSKASAPTPRCDATCCSNNCLGNSHSLYTVNCYFTTLICINADLPESKEHSWHYANVFYSNTVEMQFLQI